MNRRSFLGRLVAGLASMPFLGFLRPTPAPSPVNPAQALLDLDAIDQESFEAWRRYCDEDVWPCQNMLGGKMPFADRSHCSHEECRPPVEGPSFEILGDIEANRPAWERLMKACGMKSAPIKNPVEGQVYYCETAVPPSMKIMLGGEWRSIKLYES